MANFGEMATVAAAVTVDCDFDKSAITALIKPDPVAPPRTQLVPSGAGPEAEKILAIKKSQEASRNRDFDITQCVMDVTNSASYIVRAILQIRTAGRACPDPRACAVGIMNIISSFAWISQFTALAGADCQVVTDQRSLCAADISDMVAAVTNGPAAGISSTSDCATSKSSFRRLRSDIGRTSA